MTKPTRMLRLPAVKEITGLSKSKIYKDIKSGVFPPSIQLGGNIASWPDSEVYAFLQARAEGKNDDAVREIVKALVANRAGLFGNAA